MIPDLLKIMTILLILISGYLIVKKINELESRIMKLEQPTKIIKDDDTNTKFEEEYSTDNFINFIKKSQLGDITIMDMEMPTYQNCENQHIENQHNETCVHIHEQEINEKGMTETGMTETGMTETGMTEVGMTETGMTETVFNISDTDSDNLKLVKKYTNMKLAELQKLSKEYNIELKLNGKNKPKKLLIKEIISHLTNNG